MEMVKQHGLATAVNSTKIFSKGPSDALHSGHAITKISSWNIRTGNDRNLESAVLEMGRQGIEFCALQEVRKAKSGTQVLKIKDEVTHQIHNYTLLFSGSEKGGQHGVGILIKDTKISFLKEWNASKKFPERIMWAVLDGVTILSFYGFTETKSSKSNISKDDHKNRKTKLYEELNNIYNTLKHDKPIFICGDYNARIGFRDNNPRQAGQFGDPKENQQKKMVPLYLILQ